MSNIWIICGIIFIVFLFSWLRVIFFLICVSLKLWLYIRQYDRFIVDFLLNYLTLLESILTIVLGVATLLETFLVLLRLPVRTVLVFPVDLHRGPYSTVWSLLWCVVFLECELNGRVAQKIISSLAGFKL